MNHFRKQDNSKICKNKNKLSYSGSTNVLRNILFGTSENSVDSIDDMNSFQRRDDEMTTKEVARLIAWLKKEGYALDEIETLIKYIAGEAE